MWTKDHKDEIKNKLRSEIWFKAVRSQGPGGQNVNKVSSAAVLYWIPAGTNIWSGVEKERLLARLASEITVEGELQIRSQEHRDLERNKSASFDKLVLLLEKCLHIPKKRKKTRPSFSSVQKRIESKRQHSETKVLRRKVRSG